MGTRGLYCVVIDNQFKVAQYGQWDAYPSGQGTDVYEFLKETVENQQLEKFKERVRALRPATQEEIENCWIECGAKRGEQFVSIDVSKKVGERYPQFQRDLAAGVLQMILDGEVETVDLQTEFAADSLFCEWAYVVDLDNDVLEVYEGFQKGPHDKGRFVKGLEKVDPEHRTEDYYPVAEIIRFKVDDLPGDVESYVQTIEKASSRYDEEDDNDE